GWCRHRFCRFWLVSAPFLPVLAGVGTVSAADIGTVLGAGVGTVWASDHGASPRVGYLGLAVALLAAFGLGYAFKLGFLPIYTIIWSAMLASFFSLRVSLILVVSVSVVWYLIASRVWQFSDALLSTLLYFTFHLFALLSARTTHAAQEARRRAEALNRELAATQHLLSEAARQSERTRIARDLHDLVGHHLTALTINLQIAERLSDGEARTRIEQSHALARLLLADVRDAVSTLRDHNSVDFAAALRLMVDRVPRLNVTLDIDADVSISDVAVAEPLLRCVQEALTNTLRHSNARNTTIRLAQADDTIELSVVDDGDGTATPATLGNGLNGMRERIEQIRGSLSIDRRADSFALHVRVPAVP
ncbi:MAG: sensor histidine kinase, partial [Pseudomonadota bacterium]